MQKLLETPDMKCGDVCTPQKPKQTKKQLFLRKKGTQSHFSGTLQTERTFFHPSARGSTRVLMSTLGFASGFSLRLGNRHPEASNMKTLLNMTKLNLD